MIKQKPTNSEARYSGGNSDFHVVILSLDKVFIIMTHGGVQNARFIIFIACVAV